MGATTYKKEGSKGVFKINSTRGSFAAKDYPATLDPDEIGEMGFSITKQTPMYHKGILATKNRKGVIPIHECIQMFSKVDKSARGGHKIAVWKVDPRKRESKPTQFYIFDVAEIGRSLVVSPIVMYINLKKIDTYVAQNTKMNIGVNVKKYVPPSKVTIFYGNRIPVHLPKTKVSLKRLGSVVTDIIEHAMTIKRKKSTLYSGDTNEDSSDDESLGSKVNKKSVEIGRVVSPLSDITDEDKPKDKKIQGGYRDNNKKYSGGYEHKTKKMEMLWLCVKYTDCSVIWFNFDKIEDDKYMRKMKSWKKEGLRTAISNFMVDYPSAAVMLAGLARPQK